MREASGLGHRSKGLWWKSLLAAWLGLRAVGLVLFALDIELSQGFGFLTFVIAWLAVWAVWSRINQVGEGRNWPWAPGALGAMQRLHATFCIATLLIGSAAVTLDVSGHHDRSRLPVPLVVAVVVVVGVLSVVASSRIGMSGLGGGDQMQPVASYRTRFFARIMFAEAPALVGFAGFLLAGERAWIYGIGLAASLITFALTAPTLGSVRRDQSRLAASGADVDLLAALGGELQDDTDTG